jgi:carbon-monoxide dehydrogenase large subunit
MPEGPAPQEMRFGTRQNVRRVEDVRLLTGGGRFTDDEVPPDALWMVLRRSDHAHGRIAAIDTEAARAMPGVVAVLTGEDLADLGGLPTPPIFKRLDGTPAQPPPRPLLARGEVRHVGQPLAAVIAATRAQAQDAAEAVEVAIDPLPHATDLSPDAAEFAGSRLGDEQAVAAALGRAAHRVTVTLDNQRLVPFALEPRAAFASWDGQRVTLRVGAQNPTTLKATLADAVLKLPPAQVRVLVEDIGGGFGARSGLYPEDALVAAAALRTGRSVAWRADRTEEFLGGNHGRDQIATAEAGFDATGRILALRIQVAGNLGGFANPAGVMVPTMLGPFVATGVYDVPAFALEARAVLTNRAPSAPYRGAGRPEAILLLERVMEAAGRVTGLGPVGIRRRNLIPRIEAPHRMPNGQVMDSGDVPRLLEEALARADWEGFAARKAEAASRGKLLGRGLSTYMEWTGAGQFREAVTLEVEPSGAVTLWSATQAMGQGLATAYAQMAAAALDLPVARIAIRQGDTDRVAGFGSMASRSLFAGGSAVAEGAARTLEELRRRASDALEASEADLDYAAGTFRIAGTDRAIDLGGLAAREATRRIVVESVTTVAGPSWPNGVHVAEAEIDPDTGEVRLTRYVTLDDVGVPVNPMIVRGQIQGGIAQGAGQALCEGAVYDPATGQLLTASLMDYAIPRADLFPELDIALAEGVPCRNNPLGAKGCGESGTVGATPAVVAAVVDALAGFGVTELQMPLTAERVWRAMRGGA